MQCEIVALCLEEVGALDQCVVHEITAAYRVAATI